MPDYQNGKIYCIKSKLTDDVYIGSTTQLLHIRLSCHLSKYKRWLNYEDSYKSSYEIIKYGDAYIELLENYSCNSKKELELQEGKYQREIHCVNIRIEGQTKKEYYENNKEYFLKLQKEKRKKLTHEEKEKIRLYHINYRLENIESIKKKKKEYQLKPNVIERTKKYNIQYYKDNKDTIKKNTRKYYQNNKEKCRQRDIIYIKNNPEKNKKYQAKYRNKNREIINKKLRDAPIIICDCGISLKKSNLYKHEKTKKHQQFISSSNE